jgi:hypothetical protein
MTPDLVKRVRRDRRRQGLPPTVKDRGVLATVVQLLRRPTRGGGAVATRSPDEDLEGATD